MRFVICGFFICYELEYCYFFIEQRNGLTYVVIHLLIIIYFLNSKKETKCRNKSLSILGFHAVLWLKILQRKFTQTSRLKRGKSNEAIKLDRFVLSPKSYERRSMILINSNVSLTWRTLYRGEVRNFVKAHIKVISWKWQSLYLLAES